MAYFLNKEEEFSMLTLVSCRHRCTQFWGISIQSERKERDHGTSNPDVKV